MKAKKWLLALALAGAIAVGRGTAWGVSGTSGAVTVRSQGGYTVNGHAVAGYVPFKVGSGDEAGLWLDGAVLFSTQGEATFDWQPQTTGNHVIEFRLNGVAVTSKTVNVSSLAFWVQKGPNPPTAVDGNLSITPVTRNFGTGGGGAAIVVSGSGTWKASVSDPWITLNATSGAAGEPVAYVVGAATNAEGRTGYVYVSGHVHTVTQDGLGAVISPESATFESAGGTGTITVTPPDRMSWQARANVDWINVWPVSGTGNGTVTFTVAPLNEVVTRQGTLTVGGQTFTVFHGRRMKISPKKAEYDYLTHVIPITVDALAITSWTVEPKNSWISVVDGGRGQGGDLVTVAIGENPSWLSRAGTVTIGTETFLVTQKGRTVLEFGISPESTTASAEGANGVIAVTATPDLPWSAASQANWLTIYSDTGTGAGAGNGTVVYSAAPNPTLYERTGTIKVTPGDSKVSAKTHTVTQPAAVSALSANGYEFEAAGESCEVRVSLSDIVQWQIENKLAWLTVSGSTNRVGPGTVTLQAAPNDTVYPRSGTVTIARRSFKVSQKARGVEVEYETKLFGTDGGSDSISIHPDGQVSWTAVSSDKTWITIFGGGSGTGDGEILYIVSPYVGDGAARTGTITVGDKVVYITQRAYDLSIDPAGAVVPGNNGAGEFGVSAGIEDVWKAIVTEPWITLVEGYDQGTGNGTVRFLYTDNDTGKMRTGKIIVAGEVYTLTQKARELVEITAVAEHGGTVEGAGLYDLGTKVTLTAVPDSGYEFSHWTGDSESMENPLVFNADVPKSFYAVFAPLPIAFESVVSGTNGVALAWNNLAWATHYLLYRGTTSVPSSATVLADIPNTGDCTFLDDTGELEVEYWYWIEAEGVEDDVMGDPMTGKKQWAFPVAGDDAGVADALSATADGRLGGEIASVADYDEFRAWVVGNGLDAGEVRDSPHAWPTYALGADALFENEPDVQIAGFTPDESTAKRRGSGFTWEIRVTVKDGENAASVDADKVAARFEASSHPGDWSEASLLPLTVSTKGTDGDALLFDVTIESGTAAFLRLGSGEAVVVEPGETDDGGEEIVVPTDPDTGAQYLVVDLSAGWDAASYPVTYLEEPPEGGFNTDEYKTTKLVLRRIEAGTFTMGESGNEDDEIQHQVTLTKPYYMGVFEVTQKQWELVTGWNESYWSGDKRPVDTVSWNTIRGNSDTFDWPNSTAVDPDSFVGLLQARTGLAFDLPTEAQWEYACRAGTTTAYSHGDSVDGDYMWYWDNSLEQSQEVGTKKPNPWGLYDMHGNVWEWCLDGYAQDLGTAAVTDPKGDPSGSNRVRRGGSWSVDAAICRSAFRSYHSPSDANESLGFRLSMVLSE